MSDKHGKVLWNELNTRDLDGAKKFYAAVCGWTFESMPMADGASDYVIAKSGDEIAAGFFDLKGLPELEGVPAHWFTYLGVDDVDAAAREAKDQGGCIRRPPWDIPGVGRIAIVQDPTGAVLGLMTPSE